MARKKSAQDLFNQYQRIIKAGGWDNAALSNGRKNMTPRERRAWEAYKKYDDNITKTKSYRNAMDKANNTANEKKLLNIAQKADSRKYSQRIYMGLSNG
jgi:hypothetical protein